MRASVAAERAGVRSVSIVTSAYVKQARAVARALGVENLAIAEYPGVISTDTKAEFESKVKQVLVDQVSNGFATPIAPGMRPPEPGPRDIVYRGTLDDVQEYFHVKMWSDGLPIIPPTLDRIEAFLKFTERAPQEVIGVLPPEMREATVWNVAINGVMAGCRPEYMPVLLAVVEAIADPEFHLEDAGSGAGWEPMVILNGPVIKQLGFNYGEGVLRVGMQPNTSVGRFLRLYMRNVAGFRPAPMYTDKASFCTGFNVALAEDEDSIAELGWQPFSADRGFNAGDNAVTVQSILAVSAPILVGVSDVEAMAWTIAEAFGQGTCAYWSFTGTMFGRWHPLLLLSPPVARVLAKAGWKKDDLRKFLYDHVKIPAASLERYARQGPAPSFSLREQVDQGIISQEYCESEDPNRLVRVFLRPEWIGIVVAGDPSKNHVKGFLNNHAHGAPVTKRITLPRGWTGYIGKAG